MATTNELNRMINNVEKAITRTLYSINMLASPWDGGTKDIDPDTGLNRTFLKLSNRKSILIRISTKLHKQHLDRYALEIKKRKENNK